MNFKKTATTLFALVITLSGLSLANAVGTWTNPSATPPGNNTDAPINVGTSAQDKAGVLRVTGFRSFFDAIFDTKVQIATTATMPSNLKFLAAGDVGARRYCDEAGTNCVAATSSAWTNMGSGGGGESSIIQVYNSGLLSMSAFNPSQTAGNLAVTNPFPGKTIFSIKWSFVCVTSSCGGGFSSGDEVTMEGYTGFAGYITTLNNDSVFAIEHEDAVEVGAKNSSAHIGITTTNWKIRVVVIASV
ncbi:MAG: hypothetical protein V4664_03305 [Patescibacteria group bacterium]